jgi:anion-transporting  ArsA/GET3 family ATPase
MNVEELLDGKTICVCAGAGGVGKTTTSAVIALGMAARGLKVAVVTIDPAQRLASALGLESLENEPRRVEPERLASSGLEMRGELWAMMLDPKRTFDELIETVAPSPERAAEIKANRIYRELSTAVAGSQEFTAVSKLYELAGSGQFDLLVLDTPPSRNALDFLDAPGRLTSFLDGRALQVLLRPTGIGMRMLGIGAAPLLGALRRVTGVDLIGDITSFFSLLGGMTEQFSLRARQVEELLHSPSTAFLLVSSAQSEPINEAIWFRRRLRESGLPFAGVVVNRFHHDLTAVTGEGESPGSSLESSLENSLATLLGGDASLADRVARNFADYHVLAERDALNLARLERELDGEPLLPVPHFDDDIHDIDGLLRVHRYLFASDEERQRLLEDLVA